MNSDWIIDLHERVRSGYTLVRCGVKPGLNDQTFSSNIVFDEMSKRSYIFPQQMMDGNLWCRSNFSSNTLCN